MPIAISLSPNTENDDILLAFKTLLQPIKWFDITETEKLEKEFASLFGKEYKALAVNSGRSAEYIILKAFGIGEEDQVIIQALTCVAVPNPIIWLKAKPVYIDVDNNFNLDIKKISENIREKVKAIIVQHSFGIPADIDKIIKIIKSKKNKPIIIEDCALSLGAKYKGKMLGTFGDVSFFSFGRDKVISSVFGGMILCKNESVYKRLRNERDRLIYPSPFWVIQQLLHPIIFYIALPLYNFGINKFSVGKIIIFLSQKLKIISKSVYEEEKDTKHVKYFPLKMPGALAILARNQIKKIERYNAHRKEIANVYFKLLSGKNIHLPENNKGSIWVRFPIVTEKANIIFNCAKNKGILLGDWYKNCIYPVNNVGLVDYYFGLCPKAEKLSGNMINLPTYPRMRIKDAKRIVYLIEQCLSLK